MITTNRVTLTESDKEFLLKACSGMGKLEYNSAEWYETTLCISSKPYRSQVDNDGVFREYRMLVRLLHNNDFELFYIDVCECGTNVLDKFPDNPKHPQFILRNTTAVSNYLFLKKYPIDTKVRFYD